MRLYVTRHGQTQWNALNKVLGRTDIPLDETGRTQAQRLAHSLKEDPVISIDLILSSPLQRTMQTASFAAKELGIPVRAADELIEMDFGIYEGVLRSDPVYQAAKAEYFSRYPGGESFLDIAARVYPFLTSLPETAERLLSERQAGMGSKGESGVLLVTHNGICRVIASYFTDMTNEEFRNFTLGNCEVMRFEL